MNNRTCAACGCLTIEPAADKDGKRVFIRCKNPDFEGWGGRVLAWCREEYAAGEAMRLPRPAWCKG